MPKAKRALPLTPAALSKFLQHLDANVSIAEEKYEQLHRRLAKYFSCNGIADAEHAADLTIDCAIRKISEGAVVPNTGAFLFGIARNVLKEEHKRSQINAPLPADLPARAEDPSQVEHNVHCLEHCLQTLQPRARELFLAHYGEESREGLAARYETTMNALRIKVFNIKEKLQHCVTNCMREQIA